MLPRKQPGVLATILAILCVVFVIIAAVVASPLIALLVGMAIGWILELLTGDYVVQAFNAIGLTGVKGGDLPKVFGLLSVVAALLKSGMSNAAPKNKRKGDE